MKILLLLVFLLGCGSSFIKVDHIYKKEKEDYFQGIDPEILPYYGKFAQLYNADISSIPANFVKLADDYSSTTAGVCIEYGDSSKEIRIDLRYWDVFSEHTREILIFHELGHCYFGRSHDDSFFEDDKYGEIPKSLMYPTLIDETIYQNKYQYYIDELEY